MTPAATWLTAHGYYTGHLEHVATDPTDLRLVGPVPAPIVNRVVLDPHPVPYYADWMESYLYFDVPEDKQPGTVPVVIGDWLQVHVYPHQVVHNRECASTTCIALWRAVQDFAVTHPGRQLYRIVGISHTTRQVGLVLDYPAFELTWTVDTYGRALNEGRGPGEPTDCERRILATTFDDNYWPLDDVAEWALVTHRRDVTTEQGGPL